MTALGLLSFVVPLPSQAADGREVLDLVAQARRSMKGFMLQVPRRLPGPEGYYRPAFGCALLPRVAISGGQGMMARWECGDLTSRAILGWIALRHMTGDTETGREVEEGQRRFLLSILHPDTGLAFVPELSDPSKGTYQYHSWDQSRALRALVRWYQTSPDDRDRTKTRIDRLIRGLDDFADIRGTDAKWGPYACWSADEFDHKHRPVPHPFDRKAFPNIGELIPDPAGSCIEPLAMYAALTGDPKALDLAVRFANGEFGQHRGDKFPPDQKRFSGFAPDGSIAGHLHSKTTTLIGIVKLARCLAGRGRLEAAKRYLRQVRKTYDWILTPGNPTRGSRIGWFPERPGSGGSEICCTADMIELAAVMASCATLAPEFGDWADLYDDVESMTVNMIARGQIQMIPRFEKYLHDRYGADATGQLATARRLDGTWPTCPAPNDLCPGHSLPLSGCCQYAGVRALYSGWCAAMTCTDGQVRVNCFLNRRSPQAVMTTAMPVEGRTRIVLAETASVFLRVSNWLRAGEMAVTIDGRNVRAPDHLDKIRRYVALGRLGAGAKISVGFPLLERETSERIAGVTYTIRWRGNYVVKITPSGRCYPLFP